MCEFKWNLFYPFFRKKKTVFRYDENLLKFIISINWRTLIISKEHQLGDSPWAEQYLTDAEKTWRSYLLNESDDPGPYQHHLLFFDYIQDETGMPPGFQWYTLRATDMTLASNHDTIFSFAHFPWMFQSNAGIS